MPGETLDRPPSTSGRLAAVWRLFDRPAQRQLMIILALNVGAALLEAAGAGLVVPFIAMVGNPNVVFEQPALHGVYLLLGMRSVPQFQIAVAAGLFVFFILKNAYLVATTNHQFGFVYAQMAQASERLYAAYLRRPYEFHLRTNTAELIRNVGNEVLMVYTNVVVPLLTLFSELAVVVALLGLLLWLAPGPALLASGVLGLLMLGFHFAVRKKVRARGVTQQHELSQRIKWINQGLGGLKEIKVLGREAHFVRAFASHERSFADVSRYAMVLNQMPRLFMETAAYSALFLSVAAVLLGGGSTTSILPTLALLALAAVRLLPSVNRIVGAINRVGYYAPSIDVLATDLPCAAASLPPPPQRSHGFGDQVHMQNVRYVYPGAAAPALDEVDIRIPRGASIALVGPSGSGKTTLADVLLGLLEPSAGRVLVDGVDMRQAVASGSLRLGYIPQSIYLCDDTVRRNVAFGLPDAAIDDARVWQALAQAQLKSHVEALPQGLDTPVGDRGVSLSGGQRQRIGIARALYDDPDVLVLDEATSALDVETEREVAQAIDALAGAKTLVIIAHREATIERCTLRFHLEGGRLVR